MFKSSDKDDDDFEKIDESINESLGKLVLRLTVGGLMLFHGVAKIYGGIGPIEGMLAGVGLPAMFAYGVYVGEIVAPILMILGLWTRPAALVFAFNMVVAIGLAHRGDFFSLGPYGGWAVELAAFYLLASVVVVLIGPGRFAVGRKTGAFA